MGNENLFPTYREEKREKKYLVSCIFGTEMEKFYPFPKEKFEKKLTSLPVSAGNGIPVRLCLTALMFLLYIDLPRALLNLNPK